MESVVRYMIYNGQMMPIEVVPDTPGDRLDLITKRYMGGPSRVSVPRRSIRTSDSTGD
jgi:hypothetical protein